ncbi:hypothetical protein Ddc_19421 [Ditylenchus destructor]|nr:hypothetical protein Ddc_19421 [Ditylenchus destructor]
MSGGGRCNFTNTGTTPANFLSANPHFCKSALARYTPWHFIELVSKHQVPHHEKKLGQLFCDNKSIDILRMLLAECAAVDAQTSAGPMTCQSLVIATGGLSIPTMGATGFGYQVAKQFGHTLLPTRRGWCPSPSPISSRTCATSSAAPRSIAWELQREELPREHPVHAPRAERPGDLADLVVLAARPGGGDQSAARCGRRGVARAAAQRPAQCGAEDAAGRGLHQEDGDADRGAVVRVQADQAVHACGAGAHRGAAVRVAARAGGDRGLSHGGGHARRGRHQGGVVQDHGIAEVTGAVLHRRGAGCDRLAGRLQLPVGLGLGACGGAVCLRPWAPRCAPRR